jgi:glycosyltransferase involved in cell wall biosynthesis
LSVRWVVACKGARDGYQVALALAESDQLEALVTDAYFPLDRPFVRALGKLLRVEPSLRRRYCEGLPSSRVRANLLMELRARLSGSPSATDVVLGEIAGRLAAQNNCNLLAYSYYGSSAFNALGNSGGRKVLFEVQAHPWSQRTILEQELVRHPEHREWIARDPGLTADPDYLERLIDEVKAADLCIVPSQYVKRSLTEHGCVPKEVAVVPYGVDSDFFRPAPERTGPLRILFAGRLVYLKGIVYLLEAWKRARLKDAELWIAGPGDPAVLRSYEGLFRFLGPLDRNQLRDACAASDVFCMPSFGEGFGLIYLEAMASGAAVIATPNTGAADLVEDGRSGFIIPIQDADMLADKFEWCASHRDKVAEMGLEARRIAQLHTWEAFRANVRETLIKFSTFHN